MKKAKQTSIQTAKKSGFTILEVMLVLAISALLLIGAIAGTYGSIASSRYNDSVRSFTEYLRAIYGEAISPQSLGNGGEISGSLGNSNDLAIYGKVLVFGLDPENGERKIYSATLVGDTDVPAHQQSFMEELKTVNARLFCGETRNGVTLGTTAMSYLPPWQAQIKDTDNDWFVGTIIIARAPTSGVVHTAYADNMVYNLQSECQSETLQSASSRFREDVQNYTSSFKTTDDINFCVESEDSKIVRNVRIAADAKNSSGIQIIDTDEGDSLCRNR